MNKVAWLRITFVHWLPWAIGLTVVSGMVYLVAQQNLRMGANDPQVQIAQDAAIALANGVLPESLVSSNKVDPSISLSPFVIIYHQDNVLASNMMLNETTPVPPIGVFQYATEHGENRLTWQPQPGVRIAAVITKVNGSTDNEFVLAGRSLRETEKRINDLNIQTGILWIIGLFATLGAVGFGEWIIWHKAIS
jgi:hypothetical protein